MRWSIEVTFAEARHLLGTGQAHNRTRAAVERTVPSGLYCYTITVAWYALHGHQPGDVAEHCQRAPWYTTKTDPSLSDMVAKLRRVIIAARCMPTRPGQPTEQEKSAPSSRHGPPPVPTPPCEPPNLSERRKSSGHAPRRPQASVSGGTAFPMANSPPSRRSWRGVGSAHTVRRRPAGM